MFYDNKGGIVQHIVIQKSEKHNMVTHQKKQKNKDEMKTLVAIHYKLQSETYTLPRWCKNVGMFLLLLWLAVCSAIVIMLCVHFLFFYFF